MEHSLRKARYRHSVLLSASLLLPGAALAADNGFYLGLASSDVESDYDFGIVPTGVAEDDRGLKGIAGFRALDSFAIEANYVDLGETVVPLSIMCLVPPCPTEASIESQAFSVSAVGLFAFPLVDLYARVGYASWESESSTFSSEDREGRDPTYGAGVQVRVGSFALRFEYERFEFDDDSADLASLGFTYTFL